MLGIFCGELLTTYTKLELTDELYDIDQQEAVAYVFRQVLNHTFHPCLFKMVIRPVSVNL